MRDFLTKIIFIAAFLNLHWSQYEKFTGGDGSSILANSSLVLVVLLLSAVLVIKRSHQSSLIIKTYLFSLIVSQVFLLYHQIDLTSIFYAFLYGIGAYFTWNGFGKIFSQNVRNDGLFLFHLLFIVAISGVLSGFFGFDSFLGMTLRTKGQIFNMRPTSGLIHELNMFGYLCAFGLFLSSYMYSCSRIGWLKYCIALFVFIGGNLVSFNRSSLLAIVFGFFFFKSYKNNIDYLKKGIQILILLVSILTISNNKYFVTLSGSDIGMANREYIWPHALEKASERPLSGYGFRPGVNREVMWDYLSGILRGDEPRGAHNTFLDFLLKGGLFVGAFYLTFYLYIAMLILSYSKMKGNSPWKLFVLRIAFLSLLSSMFLSYGLGGISLASLLVNLSFYTIIYSYEDKCSSNYNESSRRSISMFRLT